MAAGTLTPRTAARSRPTCRSEHDLYAGPVPTATELQRVGVESRWLGAGTCFKPRSPTIGAVATAIISSSLVENNHDVGVFVSGSLATLEGLVVRATQPRVSNGTFGDGIAVFS